MRRIGIDVGGTNTDAVLIEEGKVVRAVKAPTSEDVTTGILDSLKSLGSTGVLAGKRIDGVMIGTTHFISSINHCPAANASPRCGAITSSHSDASFTRTTPSRCTSRTLSTGQRAAISSNNLWN